MGRDVRQSTAAILRVGPVVDAGGAVLTTATIVAKLAKAGGALGARSDATAIAHDSDGYYLLTLGVTDTNTVGRLRVAITGAGFLPFCEDCMVLAQAVYDVLYGTVAPATLAAADVWAVATRALTDKAGFTVGAGGITAASFAAGAITAAAIADDALGALELSAGAAAEVAAAVRAELAAELGRIDDTVSSRLAAASYTAGGTTSDIATAVWTTTDALGLAVPGSPGAILAGLPVAEGGTVQGSPTPTITKFTLAPLAGITLNLQPNAYASGRMCARPRDGNLGGAAFPVTASAASGSVAGGVEFTVSGLTSELTPGVTVDVY